MHGVVVQGQCGGVRGGELCTVGGALSERHGGLARSVVRVADETLLTRHVVEQVRDRRHKLESVPGAEQADGFVVGNVGIIEAVKEGGEVRGHSAGHHETERRHPFPWDEVRP